jgi:hypothetical protein
VTNQGTFTVVGSLATGRAAHTATVMRAGPYAGSVLVVGGRGRSGTTDVVLDSAEIFNPSAGSWIVSAGTLNGSGNVGFRGRMSHGAAAIATGEVVIAGGQTDIPGVNTLNTCEYYNPTQDAFLPVSGTLTNPKSDPAMFAYDQQGVTQVLIAGGRQTATQAVRSANIFQGDVKQINATTAPTMLTGAFAAHVLQLPSGKLLVVGGQDSGTAQGSEVYDPVASTFATMESLLKNRTGMGAAVLGAQVAMNNLPATAGQPAVFGGMNGTTVLNSIEVYDEVHAVWTQVKSVLTTARSGCTATSLSNGDVLVIGGTDSSGHVLSSTEVIMTSGSGPVVLTGPNLQFPRSGHTATLIQLGGADAILVAGGVDASGAPIASCEVFALPGTVVPNGSVANGVVATPTISTLSPTGGPQGTQVMITGTNYPVTLNQNIVRFNGIVAPVMSGNTTSLTVKVPNGAFSGNVTVQVGSQTSNGEYFNVLQPSATGTGVSPFSGPPNILVILPNPTVSIPILGSPVLVGGSNFDQAAIPYFGTIPSVQLTNFGLKNIPLIGSISAGFTVVPPSISSGTTTNVTLQEYGLVSNIFPLQVN